MITRMTPLRTRNKDLGHHILLYGNNLPSNGVKQKSPPEKSPLVVEFAPLLSSPTHKQKKRIFGVEEKSNKVNFTTGGLLPVTI